jgi:glycosyltransferase involved in cell wall biosynthesis
VAVVIPVYNKSEVELRRAIESVIKQTYNNITGIVVVDDGSGNPDEIREWASSYDKAAHQVRLIRRDNAGVAVARNHGISLCNSKYICCLDADDEIQPTFIETCVSALEKDPSLGIAYTSILDIFPEFLTYSPMDARLYRNGRQSSIMTINYVNRIRYPPVACSVAKCGSG